MRPWTAMRIGIMLHLTSVDVMDNHRSGIGQGHYETDNPTDEGPPEKDTEHHNAPSKKFVPQPYPVRHIALAVFGDLANPSGLPGKLITRAGSNALVDEAFPAQEEILIIRKIVSHEHVLAIRREQLFDIGSP
jgi:hypothetical protein